MATDEPLKLNLGSLRSAMSLTLHTHHASRIWHGRAAADGRPGIVGLNGYIVVMNKMKRGSEQDDPYSDWWMLRIEDKLDQTKATLQSLREQVDQALAGVPAALSLGENLNVQPVKLPLFVNAQLGFLRWRRQDRSAMGVALWQEQMTSISTPVNLLEELLAIEQQRVVLNMQISLLHALGRQARECASKLAQAEDCYVRRLQSIPAALRGC